MQNYIEMKRLPIILTVLVFICCLSCKQRNQSIISSVTDKVFLYPNNPTEEHINWYHDSILNSMNDQFKTHLTNNNINLPDSPVQKLQKMEEILHTLFDYDASSESHIDIEWDLQSQSNQLELLNLYILKELEDVVSESLYKELTEEKLYIWKVIDSQQDFLRKHYDKALYDGVFSFMKYYQVEIKILKDWQNSLKGLYFAYYTPKDSLFLYSHKYKSISDFDFDRAYNHIINDLIPIKPYRESVEPTYDAKEDKIAALNLKSIWFKFIENREKISKLLPQEKKIVWDNATNRFKRSNLILIKNEFEGLGYCSNDVLSVILPDNCSYKELFSYANFSTKWKEYCDD